MGFLPKFFLLIFVGFVFDYILIELVSFKQPIIINLTAAAKCFVDKDFLLFGRVYS